METEGGSFPGCSTLSSDDVNSQSDLSLQDLHIQSSHPIGGVPNPPDVKHHLQQSLEGFVNCSLITFFIIFLNCDFFIILTNSCIRTI
jgi:hypothetical protein